MRGMHPVSLLASVLAAGLVAAPPVLGQSPTPPPPSAPDETDRPGPSAELEFALGDGVVAVVGRHLIRRNDVLAAFEGGYFESVLPELGDLRRATDPGLRRRGLEKVLIEMLRDHLKTEGGRLQGFGQDAIDAMVDRRIADLQRDYGGAAGASERLRGSGYDPASFGRRHEEMILRVTWERMATGRAPGPLGRVNTDRFVPPGLLALQYQNLASSPRAEDRATVGETPRRYVLEQTILGLAEYRSVERAQEVAERIRAEILAGGLTMERAAREFTLPQERVQDWRIDPLSEPQVRALARSRFDGTEMAAWVLGAAPGDVSPPLLLSLPGPGGALRPRALVVMRLAEVLPPQPARRFEDQGLQAELTRSIQADWDEARVEQGLYELLEATYVYPPQLKADLLRKDSRAGAQPQGTGAAPAPRAGGAAGVR